jgi:ABC-2 type transport system permease protein
MLPGSAAQAASAGPRLRWLAKYGKAFEMGFQSALEYRVNFLISLISAAYPIFIQTFLWTAIYSGSGEAVMYGYTYRQMLVYTFLAGLVARLVRTGFEYEIMEDVKNGRYSKFLVQPLGYFAYRLASYFGQKTPGQVMILAILAVVLVGLNAFWGFAPGLAQILLFLLAILLAMVLNFMIFYCFSAVAFWLVDIGFLFEGIRITTILLSGGIFPLEVFGERFMQVTNLLPFKYTISYPINVLNGKIVGGEIAQGMLIQLFWIGACLLLANLLWKQGGRRYVAVGG